MDSARAKEGKLIELIESPQARLRINPARQRGLVEPHHVLHLVHGLDVGGLEVVVKRLVEGLDTSRFRATVCCFDERGTLAGDVERAGAPVLLLARRPGVDWRYPFRLARLLRKRKVDLIHLHTDMGFFYGVLAATLARTQGIIYTEHGRTFPASRRKTLAFQMLASLKVHTASVSAALQRNLVHFERFRPSRMTVIPNGVARPSRPDRLTLRRVREEMGARGGEVLIGTIGRLQAVKGHLELIRALPELFHAHPHARLAIVGGGPLQDTLQKEIERLDMTHFVKLMGERREVAPYLHAFDLFVLPSWSEGLPLSLLEAFAAGKPAVAMNVGGVAEVMQQGVEGFLVPPGHFSEFSKRIRQLIDRPNDRQRMGANGRETYQARFTVERMVAAYDSLYEKVLERRRPERLHQPSIIRR